VSTASAVGGEPRLYSTLSRRVEPLITGPNGVVRIYVCGPTVYGPIHVGNARPFVVFSVLKRYLTRRGYAVRFVSNVTDVNDKIYVAAQREGVPSAELAERYLNEYVTDTDRLGLGRPDVEPTVTGHMPEIIALIARLIAVELAYPSAGDVYFRVDRFPGYGKLSGRRLDEMLVTEPGGAKEHPLDFALWKGHKPGEDTSWDSPWGPGRPGWHIECSAMAQAALGPSFEIHGGGIDLAFPHHENEIAQSEGANGVPMAGIWAHNEMLELGGKMSKSEGNIVLLRDALDRWGRDVLVAFFLRTHYRSKLPFGDAVLEDTGRQVETIRNAARTLDRAESVPGEGINRTLADTLVAARSDFFDALDDDFHTPRAFAALFEVIHAINRAVEGDRPGVAQLQAARAEFVGLLDVLGLADLAAGPPVAPAEIAALAAEREVARVARDFVRADALRAEIESLGYDVRDTPEGPQVTPR
jgi:cysteinyl-tRNA synthetase